MFLTNLFFQCKNKNKNKKKKKKKKKKTSYSLSYKCYSQLFTGVSFIVLKRGCIVVKHIFAISNSIKGFFL